MNNKGFTLIELIMVIALLAIIGLLSVPNIIKMINKNKVDNYNSTIDSIIEATKLYVSDNRYSLTFKDNDNCTPGSTGNISTTIPLSNLITSKNIKESVKNFCTDENIKNTTEIKVTLNCSTKQFSYDIQYNDTTTNLITKIDVTDDDTGKILEGKYCSDLYE